MTCENDRLISVRIFNIYPYADVQQGVGPQNFLVFLKGEEDKVVPITIGQFEGQALAMALRKIPLPRPLPHNLLQNLLQKMKAKVHKLVIHTLKDEVFHAYLLIETKEDAFYLDCRPSDGMILSTILGTPIYVSPEVMEEAGRILEIEQGEGEEEKASLRVIQPEPGEGESSSREEGAAGEKESEGDQQMSKLEKLKLQLNRLIAEEAYEEAARIRDQINRLEEE